MGFFDDLKIPELKKSGKSQGNLLCFSQMRRSMAARIGIRGRLAKQVKKMETRAEVLEDEARHLRKEADSLKHAIALIIAKKHDRETEEGYKANARRRLQIAKELGLAVAGVLKQRYR